MNALVRGSCPVCGRDVALRKGGLVREHRGDLCRCGHPLEGHHRFRYNCLTPGCACAHDELATCTGSGKPNGCDCSVCQANGFAASTVPA